LTQEAPHATVSRAAEIPEQRAPSPRVNGPLAASRHPWCLVPVLETFSSTGAARVDTTIRSHLFRADLRVAGRNTRLHRFVAGHRPGPDRLDRGERVRQVDAAAPGRR